MFILPRLLALLALAAAVATFSSNSHAQTLDCGPLVSLQNGIIIVEPAPDDDTEEIQCALDSAGDLGVSTVKLTSGIYAISDMIMVEDFEGTFEGQSKSATDLLVFSGTLDCDAIFDSGRLPAAFKFINGNAKVAKMTLSLNTPCDTNMQFSPFYLLHFTGSSANSGCDSETGFSQVDRVDIFNNAPANAARPNIAVGVFAEGAFFDTCRDTQLGTHKTNRSLIADFPTAIELSLRGGAQVDQNFNVFLDNGTGINAVNANQLLTVQSNDFISSPINQFSVFDGIIGTNTFGPNQNRIVVYNNDFLIENENTSGQGIFLVANPNFNVSVAASDNLLRIDGSGSDMTFSSFAGINNASISGNRLVGSGFSGIDILDGEGNVISGNNLFNYVPSIGDNVFFGTAAESSIVGPGQGAVVLDEGSNNTVIGPQGMSPEAIMTRDRAEPGTERLTAIKQYVANAKSRIAANAAKKGSALSN